MAFLPTNYIDDVLDVSVNRTRKFNMITNADGTVSFEDATVYLSNGTEYGASDINTANRKINSISRKVESITGAILIEGVAISLKNKVFEYSRSDVTADTLAMIYFADEDLNIVSTAGIIATTGNGVIRFESDVPISSNIRCSIYLFGTVEEEGV